MNLILKGVVFAYAWNSIIVLIWEVPTLTIPMGVGFAVILSVLRFNVDEASLERDSEDTLARNLVATIYFLFVLFFIWILNFFI